MNDQDRLFYRKLFPCLNDSRWQETGSESTTYKTAFGQVWWQIPFDFNTECGQIEARIGLIVYPANAKLFAQVTAPHPGQTYSQDLKCSPKSSTMLDIEQEARESGQALITSNLAEIKAVQTAWLRELDAMTGVDRP